MRYAKFVAEITAAVGAAAVAGLTTDGVVTASEWVNVVIMGLGAVTVYGAANIPAGIWIYAKGILAAATAITVLLQSILTGGATLAEWIQFGLAALGALGVTGVPNKPKTGVSSGVV